MKTILFAEGLLAPVLSRHKKITLRKYRSGAHDFIEGEFIEGRFADGETTLTLRLLADTEIVEAGKISDIVAREDGFRNAHDMLVRMRRYYPDFGPATQVAIVRFELAENSEKVA